MALADMQELYTVYSSLSFTCMLPGGALWGRPTPLLPKNDFFGHFGPDFSNFQQNLGSPWA